MLENKIQHLKLIYIGKFSELIPNFALRSGPTFYFGGTLNFQYPILISRLVKIIEIFICFTPITRKFWQIIKELLVKFAWKVADIHTSDSQIGKFMQI